MPTATTDPSSSAIKWSTASSSTRPGAPRADVHRRATTGAAQRVYLWAVDDPRSEGDRVVVIQHSTISGDERFDGAAVRKVNVLVCDNDTPGVYVMHVEPRPTTQRRSVVLDGAARHRGQRADRRPAAANPTVPPTSCCSRSRRTDGRCTSIWVQALRSMPTASACCASTSSASRADGLALVHASSTAPARAYRIRVRLDATGDDARARSMRRARNDSDPGDPTTAVIHYELDAANALPAAAAAYLFPNLRSARSAPTCSSTTTRPPTS